MVLRASTIRADKCKEGLERDPESTEHGFGELVYNYTRVPWSIGSFLRRESPSKNMPAAWSHSVGETLVHSRVYSGCKYKWWRNGPFRAPSLPSSTVRLTLPDEGTRSFRI